MEKTLRKAKKAVVKTWCDSTGEVFKEFGLDTPAPIEITITFGYGSEFDEETLTLHYSDKGFKPIADAIKTNLSKKTKEEFKKLASQKTCPLFLKSLSKSKLQ